MKINKEASQILVIWYSLHILHGQKKRTDNTIAKRKTDNTMTKRRIDNTMAKRTTGNTMSKRTTGNTMAKRQTMVHKLYRKLKIEKHEPIKIIFSKTI